MFFKCSLTAHIDVIAHSPEVFEKRSLETRGFQRCRSSSYFGNTQLPRCCIHEPSRESCEKHSLKPDHFNGCVVPSQISFAGLIHQIKTCFFHSGGLSINLCNYEEVILCKTPEWKTLKGYCFLKLNLLLAEPPSLPSSSSLCLRGYIIKCDPVVCLRH